MSRDPKSMTLPEIDAAIDALYAERARARRTDPSLVSWDKTRLLALQQEAADRIPEGPDIAELLAATQMAGHNGQG